MKIKKMNVSKDRLLKLLGLIDLTSLNDARNDDILALCGKAETSHGKVAAVCSWPEFTSEMSDLLDGKGIPVAVVLNFPSGEDPLEEVVAATREAVAAGANELDLVWPYRTWQQGQEDSALELITTVKKAAGGTKLKVIVESGAFSSLGDLRKACSAIIGAGADVLKTSTGKIPKGASLDAARIMLDEIRKSGMPIGFKASGGIRTTEEANSYLSLAEETMGHGWPTPETFRIGASRLLDDILGELE